VNCAIILVLVIYVDNVVKFYNQHNSMDFAQCFVHGIYTKSRQMMLFLVISKT